MIDDVELWVYFGGREPAHLKPLLDAMRDLPPLSDADSERLSQGIMKRIDEATSRRAESSTSGRSHSRRLSISDDGPRSEGKRRSARVTDSVSSRQGPTARSPSFDETSHARLAPTPKPRKPSVDVEPASPPASMLITAPEPTVPLGVLPSTSGLPFKPAPTPTSPPLPRKKLDEPTVKVPVMRLPGAETSPIETDAIQRAIAVLPFVGNTVGAGLVAFPRLTLEQYASFRVELSLWPERSAQIYRRYHVVNKAASDALNEHWTIHFEGRPEARAEFERAFAEYMAWMRRVPNATPDAHPNLGPSDGNIIARKPAS